MENIPWWVVIIILIGAYIAMNQIYIPYKTVPINDPNAFCENDTIKLKNDIFGLGKFSFEMQASMKCIEYKTSRCVFTCENNIPSCRCEATILDRLLSHEGEWLLER